jgi:hypothetical protein
MALPNYATPPNLGVTAGSAAGSGSVFQGTALPNITTTQQQATATPQFYTDYLNQLATQGAGAAQNARYIGAQPLQAQAFKQVAQNVGNYQPALNEAMNYAGSVGDSNLSQALGNLNQQNIATSLAPNAVAGIAGTGQFGSQRGANALGSVISNANISTQAQQAQAMQQDYANRLAAASQLGSLAGQQQQYGLGDVNALATLGSQQQQIAQNAQLFPMQQLTAESNLLKGATIPTSTSTAYTGPIPGAYNLSPLQQIAGLGALAAGTADLLPKLGASLGDLTKTIGGALPSLGNIFSGTSTTPDASINPSTADLIAANAKMPSQQDMIDYNSVLQQELQNRYFGTYNTDLPFDAQI